MNSFRQLVFTEQTPSHEEAATENYWDFSGERIQLFDTRYLDQQHYLAELVYKIQQHPKNLSAHVQRIYCCYRNDLVDPLFAALVDFFIVLNKRGKKISLRMLTGTESKLTDPQITLLKAALSNRRLDDNSLIPGNGYSIFGRGLSGTVNLVEKLDNPDSATHDPLQLAEDAVEYCQLEEATAILENAVVDHPERIELHEALLEIYKSTDNQAGFETTLKRMRDLESLMPDGIVPDCWSRLKDYFDQQ